MRDMLQSAAEHLADRMADHAAQPVDYLRGTAHIPWAATIGATTREVDRGDGLIVQFGVIDFVGRAADLVVGGEQIEPQPGDRIEARLYLLRTWERRTCEVQSAAAGEPCWEPSDRYGIRIRVHTKLIEAV